MPFAQLVIGSPGAGKSTYCNGMHQFMSAIGRKCSVVNLDPANDHTSYPVALDVRDLVTLEEIMEAEDLGPNGGVLYALEELEHNLDWLEAGLKELGDDYILFDCPGQVELFTHHSSLRHIFLRLEKLGYRLVVVQLTDSYVISQPSLYISALLVALRGMLQMDLPHINVLTKIDNLRNYPDLPFNLDFYTEVQALDYLQPHLEAEQGSRFGSRVTASSTEKDDVDMDNLEDEDDPGKPKSKFSALNSAICEMIENFGLLSFHTLAVEDKQSMLTLLRAIDRAGGYAFGAAEGVNETVWQVAMREGETMLEPRDVQERWLDRRDEFDEMEREAWKKEAEAEGDGAPPGPQSVRVGEDGKAATPVAGEKSFEDMDIEEMEALKKSPAPWKSTFLSHIGKLDSPEFVLSTLQKAPEGSPVPYVPRARYCIFRGFFAELPENTHNEAPMNERVYESDMPTFTTDVRMLKVPQLFGSSAGHANSEEQWQGSGGGGPVEAVYWVKPTMTQWRVKGEAFILGPDIEGDGEESSGVRTVKSELGKRMRVVKPGKEKEWSWETEMTAHFGNTPPGLRGRPVTEPYDEENLKLGTKVDDLHHKVARKNFRVVVIRPQEVEQTDLSDPEKARRYLYTYSQDTAEWKTQELWP
ncbi:putative atp binding protein [Neofusicoccum parvum UCRNP2]|uniref:ATP-binding domain 1 family member B homolog n=1 Tax=Botryosphaeria parva (strain UCR-NP2) TaxID=1287680 RepID=R1GBK4_BOTPV|nr:putative atp binding protein [Neofusicoccum parvum UCRNP2]